MKSCLHFVGFDRFDQHYWNAVAVFGRPAFLHRRWGRRARREIAPDDSVIFANGEGDQAPSRFNGDDEYYAA